MAHFTGKPIKNRKAGKFAKAKPKKKLSKDEKRNVLRWKSEVRGL